MANKEMTLAKEDCQVSSRSSGGDSLDDRSPEDVRNEVEM